MAIWLKQSTAVTLKIGPFLDETNGKDAETGLTISQAEVRLSKNGGDIAQKNESTSCTHDELGVYGCPLDTTDTDTLGRLQLWVHESGALPVWNEFMVVPANVWDSLYGADYLQTHMVEITGDVITAAAIADNAIAAEHLAAGAIDFATFAADCKTGSGLKANVESISANAITATAINADAITSAKIADDAISSEHLNTGAITADAFAADAIVAATLATGAITADAFAADSIVAATLATGAITADAFAADAIVAATLATGAITADAFAANAIVAATLAGDCITSAKIADNAIAAEHIAANAIDAATFAADVDAEVATYIWNAAAASYGGAGTYGQAVEDILADTNELQADDTPGALSALETHGDSEWATATGFSTHSAADVWGATNATLSLTYAVIASRLYRFLSNKMNITDATGGVALRNEADDGDLATQSITDDDTTTIRTALSWA